MRIVGGRLKGRTLHTPKGRATRPTSDRAREAVFNVLSHAPWSPFADGDGLSGARVLDLFAGSGALGFEALSRGAAFCLFVDTDAAARGVIRTNAEAFDLMGVARIHRRSATQLGTKPAGLGAPFTLAFLDPPYGQALIRPTLTALQEGDWLTADALIMAERGADETDWAAPDGFDVLDERAYGAARVVFLKAC